MVKRIGSGLVLVIATVGMAAFLRPVKPAAAAIQAPTAAESARWAKEAAATTIIRDDWGIAHVHGKTDADAVFGMEYAQAEDDFNRIEMNYLNALGRTAEAEGQAQLFRDLRMRLITDPEVLKTEYAGSPASLKALMDAFADGLNYYLDKHPDVHPKVITHFEPWMALSFTEGSIGWDIEKVNVNQLQAFYGTQPEKTAALSAPPPPGPNFPTEEGFPFEPGGSNGAAIAPGNTVDHHALLLINPHTSFYFRSELQMSSDQGLNAYGAVTWGNFFIYQGFNDRIGWMHTSSGADATDEFLETVTPQAGHYLYKHGDQELPVTETPVTIRYKTDAGMAQRTFTVYHTQHGPVIGQQNGKWMSFSVMVEHVKALTQSYTRTKAMNYKEFRQDLELHTDSSNNTIYADADGNIAYFHGNYIPKRDPKFDWTKPVDGSDPATDYHGLLSVDETPHLLNPASGWLYNSNNWPWSAAGPSSPKQSDFPAYVDTGRHESPRGDHAVMLFSNKKDFTVEGLRAAAYDSYQPWFAKTIPVLVKAWDSTPDSDPLKAKLHDQIAILRPWDFRWGTDSVATTIAVYFGSDINRHAGAARGETSEDYVAKTATPEELLQSLANGCDRLTSLYGTWNTPWGAINRFQRLNDNIQGSYDDAKPSTPVMFTTATWGSLASFAVGRGGPNVKKNYGSSGNSFVAVVEFGPTVKAIAVTAGGESGDPASKHFADQIDRYATGNLRPVYFYPAQLKGHTEREYHPGN